MSLKNLKDALYNAGHSGRDNFERREETRRARKNVKRTLRQVDIHCDEQPNLHREPRIGSAVSYRGRLFNKWLESQVGRPWENVCREAHNHLGPMNSLPSLNLRHQFQSDIAPSDIATDRWYDYEVDENGIFQKAEKPVSTNKRPQLLPESPQNLNIRDHLEDWSDNRAVCYHEDNPWWFMLFNTDRGLCWKPLYPLSKRDREIFFSLDGFLLHYIQITNRYFWPRHPVSHEVHEVI